MKASFLCVSANPAIDKRARIAEFRLHGVNRLTEVAPEPGGKAAHVAMALRALGEQPMWLGFAGGATGDQLIAGIEALGIKTQVIETQRSTRVNLEVVDDAGMVTEILELGPSISRVELDRFREACSGAFSQMDDDGHVIFSGSLPPGAPCDLYGELVHAARLTGCRTFVDTSGGALKSALELKPDFVKPNREEAESVTGESITDLTSARRAIAQILVRGARSVALSLGKDGLLWCPAEGEPVVYAQHPAIEARSSVGSGDATVAGFATAIARHLPVEEVARWAAACGAANCVAPSPGQIKLADVQLMAQTVRVERIV
jgi:tagatose 6-phosphate kinase